MTMRRLSMPTRSRAWHAVLAAAMGAAAPCSNSAAAEPNETFATATVLLPGVLAAVDELSPPGPEPDTLLGVRNQFGSVYATDDDGNPVGNGYASGLGGVPMNSGAIDFSVTGYTDTGFSGAHSERGAYRVFVDVYDFFDEFLETITADRVMQPGVVDDFSYNDFEWLGGSFDVYIDNTVGGTLGDVDFFTFTGLTPGAAFTATTVDPLTSGVDTVLGWFDAAGLLVDFDDDGAGGLLSKLTGVIPDEGTLTFAVTGLSDDEFMGLHNSEGSYELRLTLGGAFSADFDDSGGVRGADLAIWKSNFHGPANGDADADGDTDGNDFLLWQRQLGSGAGATQIPEPGALVLAMGALVAGGAARRGACSCCRIAVGRVRCPEAGETSASPEGLKLLTRPAGSAGALAGTPSGTRIPVFAGCAFVLWVRASALANCRVAGFHLLTLGARSR